jgi:hypothetical protein
MDDENFTETEILLFENYSKQFEIFLKLSGLQEK